MFARIDELLHEHGMRMAQLAEAVGVSTGNVSDWKSGKTRPSVTVLMRIADYFNVSVDYLVGRTDIPNTGELIDIYNLGIMRWMNDRAFQAEDTAVLKDNFYEFLARYKDVIATLANSMCLNEKKNVAVGNVSYSDLTSMTCEAVKQPLRSLICWAASFPLDVTKTAAGGDADVASLTDSVYNALGVLTDGKMEVGCQTLTEEERDLLEIWSCLDKPGRRIVIGAAEDQRQRVTDERKKTSHETA